VSTIPYYEPTFRDSLRSVGRITHQGIQQPSLPPCITASPEPHLQSLTTASTPKNPTRRTPPQTDVLIRAVLDPHGEIGQLSHDIGLLLAREDFIRRVDKIDPMDQARLVDRVDKVRFQTAFLFLLSLFPLGTFRCIPPSTHETQSHCALSESSAVPPSDSRIQSCSPRDLRGVVTLPSRPEDQRIFG